MMDNEYIYGKNDLFVLLIIFKSLLKQDELKEFILELSHIIDNLEYNLKTISINKILDRMGFPKNWKDIVDISKNDLFN